MITKNIKKYMMAGFLGCGIMTTTTSCNDFLDLLPQNQVVLENYWTQKNDVTSVLMSCYESLQSEDCITRMGLWGEVRSDNMKLGVSPALDLQQLVKENILPSNTFCDWKVFYQAINRCNTVCFYAPKVQEIDPNYSYSEMQANVAEAVFIRSLCYFYLIRTFRDVPFSREPSIDDTQDYRVPADSFDVVLNNIIADLEAVKDQAQLYFLKPNPDKVQEQERNNTARVTRPAVYALLADLYLWQGNWQRCAECCDFVINYKQTEFENLRRRLKDEINLFNDIPLIKEKQQTISGHAYDEIFGKGNSFESIFELTYDQRLKKDNKNSYITRYYINSSNNLTQGSLAAVDEFYEGLPTKGTELFMSNDCRAYESIYQASTTQFYIGKYAASRVALDNSRANWQPAMTWRGGESDYSNWIVYRLTDVVLMKAEALIQMGSDHFEEAFDLINAVNRRAFNVLTAGSGEVLKLADYKDSKENMEQLVMDERHRELMFEGKRWYDLVRVARRQGSTRDLAKTVVKKQLTNTSGIQIRLADPNALYLPYFRNELKVNPYLKQNPAYNTGDDADLSKN